MDNVEYYRPSLDDADSLFLLEQICFPSPWDLQEIKALIQRDPVLYTIGAFVDGSAVGYISATISEPGTLHVISLCVHPEQRRRGIAGDLLGSALYWGRHMEAERTVLEVRTENSPAIEFYGNSGFTVQKTLPDFYGEGENGIFMEKPLVPLVHTLNTSLYLNNRLNRIPRLGVILGSGIGWATEPFGIGQSIPFSEIPSMAGEAVEGHSHTLQTSKDGRIIFVMGRRHHYQGYSGREITLLPAALAALGVGTWVLTSSSGAVDPDYSVGDAMIFTDHINFSGCIPDPPEHSTGHSVYSLQLQEIAGKCMKNCRRGVFASVSGPAYETAAEVALIRESGASAVSMSTVQEALALRSMGCRVLALALITNAVDSGESVCHDEVLSAQNTVREKQEDSFIQLLKRLSK
ncbi:MAG: GNAT family N-acetyltransferase [Candidatus Sabulitectum sp.]|nr:GNAT family N-acetyltransferase [Candidatus Sabulitectum sp.]